MKKTISNFEQKTDRLHGHFINKLYIENAEFKVANGRNRKYHIVTFGCQMNAHDSEKIEKYFVDMGYEKSDELEESDVIVYNTCCVRENAENKVFGNLGLLKHLKEQGRKFKTIVCGCMMQQETVIDKIKKTYRNVDVCLGTFNLHRLPQLLWTSFETDSLIIDIWETYDEVDLDLPYVREKKFRSSVNIMYGCNNFCSYCIVPYVRGRERSRQSEDIIKECKALSDDGVKEIMLLGQNVNSYGNDAKDELLFSVLLNKISEINGIERIRFMTSHPKDLSDELIKEFKTNPKLCKSLHLPVQSGSNRILSNMNRGYSREDILGLVKKLRLSVPDITLTTDIIVGFPGETEEDLIDTIDLIEKIRVNGAYTFLYSKRQGTPAAKMTDQIPVDVAKERFQRLLSAVNRVIFEENNKFIGKSSVVLCEEISEEGLISARTDGNLLVHFKAEGSLPGDLVKVRFTENKTFYCMAEKEK